MKSLVVVALLFSAQLLSVSAQANYMCSSIFAEPKPEKLVKLETETQDGKPRYFYVRNYSHFKGGELDAYLKSLKNLTQFSEKLLEINTMLPDREMVPSEAFFVANQIVPLVEMHLRSHEVNFRIESFEENGNKRTLIVIAENGSNPLNALSKLLWDHMKVSLVVNPIDLFYGYDHYNKTQGRRFDIDGYNEAYSVSLHLLLHSQRKDFDYQIAKHDKELHDLNVEIQGEIQVKSTDVVLESLPLTTREESQLVDNQRRAEVINAQIEAARKKKKGSP